jgi:hypothetical protein
MHAKDWKTIVEGTKIKYKQTKRNTMVIKLQQP